VLRQITKYWHKKKYPYDKIYYMRGYDGNEARKKKVNRKRMATKKTL
jgi:hypothetical protein